MYSLYITQWTIDNYTIRFQNSHLHFLTSNYSLGTILFYISYLYTGTSRYESINKALVQGPTSNMDRQLKTKCLYRFFMFPCVLLFPR